MLGKLFLTFFQIGAFTFGGGYAMVPLIQQEVCNKKGWLSEEDFLNCLALAQSAPGPLAVNTATYIGYKLRGLGGALAAAGGAILPSFLIILVIASTFQRFAELAWVQKAFLGMRPAIFMLMAFAVYSLGKKSLKGKGILLAALYFGLLLLGLSSYWVLILAGVVGFWQGRVQDGAAN